MPLDPQLQALQISLNDAISGGQLVLNEANMNGASSLPVVALFQQAFRLDAITINGTIKIVPDPVNDLLLVSGTGVTTLYGLTGTAVSLTFGSATPTTLSCYGTVTPPTGATPWKFSKSFPALAETYFDQLNFTSPKFTISTYAVANATLGVTLVEGAGMYIKPTGLTGPLAPLLELNPTVPNPLPPFYGPLAETATTLNIRMAMPFSPVTVTVVDFPTLSFPQTDVFLIAGESSATSYSSQVIIVEGDVDFGGIVTMPLALNVPWEDSWQLSLVPQSPESLPSLTTFLTLFSGVDVANVFPDSFQILPGFSITAFWASFDLQTGITPSWGFNVSTAPVGGTAADTLWVILPGVIELTALAGTIMVNIVRPGGNGPPETLVRGTVGGIFRLGGTLELMVALPVPNTLDSGWTISTQNALPLPSLDQLASLVAGVDVGLLLPPGVAGIGAFTLQSLVLIVTPATLTIESFSFRLGSTNPWTIIENQLSIQNLTLEFLILDPFATRAVSGSVYGTIRIGASSVKVLVQRPQYGIDWSLRVSSELIPLPSIEDLDGLIGTSIAPYLPSTLATLSFAITDLLINLNLSQAKIQQIAFGLECNTEWTILPNVLVVQATGLTVNLSWYTGEMVTEFGIWGELLVVGKRVDVSAMRESDGNWTFTGGLAKGETIDLVGMVAQFLGFEPAYMPVSMSIEGLLVQFTTNDSSFLVAGRTAGFWTFEVSSALTLQMGAAASFQRNAAGESSGYLTGEFRINNLQINVSYAFDPTSSTFIFQIIYKRFSLSAALTSGTDAKGNEYSLLKFSMGDLTLGEILEWLVNLASPGSDFKLSAPWDVLNQINLKNLSLIIDLKTWDVTVNYAIDVNLVFMKITGIGLKYSDAGGEGSVLLQLSGSFLGQDYSIENNNALQWDVLNEPAPDVPASGPTLIDLKYVGLGQQVAFSDISELDTVGQVIAAMRTEMQEVNDGSRNPLATGNGSLMRFDRSSHLLLGADFEILETVSLSFIFNDPYIYGLRLGLVGSRVGSMAGLQFELLYKKITNDIGVFKVELRVPDAFRQWEFGYVSITLPVIKVDIYTNGNFRVDLGFPKNGDFSDSFAVQVFPFIGFGGFYFAYLTGATSKTVPVITNGTFAPVIEFGIGLSIGLGKEIRKGPLSGGIYVTVIGILEGTVAWFTPSDKAAADGTFYRISGMVGIVGKVYGKVDFAVIKVSVSLTARLTVRLTLEAYQATTVQVTVEVEASATVTIFFIDIDFSFKVSLDEQFVIGSPSKTPWLVAPKSSGSGQTSQPQLRGQRTSYQPRNFVRTFRSQAYSDRHLAARASGLTDATLAWTPLLVFPAKKTFHMSLLPALTVATQSSTTAVQLDFVLLLENSIAPGAQTRAERLLVTAEHSSRTDVPADLSFNLLVQLMFLWTTSSVLGRTTGDVTAADLDAIYAELLRPATFDTGFAATNLLNLLAANFNGQMAGLPADPGAATKTSGTVFAMLPQLNYVSGATTFDFAVGNPVSPAYETQIREYYEQLLVDYEWGRANTPGANGGSGAAARMETTGSGESMATLIFRESLMILARSVFESASKALAAFVPAVPANASLNSIAAGFPPVAGTYTVHEGDTVESIAGMFGMSVAKLQALNNNSLHNPLTAGATVNVQIAVTAQSVAWANRNASLNVPASPAPPIQLPLANVLDQVASGDSLSSIATAFNIASVTSIVQIAVNSANRQLLAAGASMTIAQPAAPVYNWFAYTSVAGDNLQRIAVWAYVRTAGRDPQPNGAWYAQTIATFNTNPQAPYAGPNLAGVIATGTSLTVPKALHNSTLSDALTYVTRSGDTLDFVAGYFDVIQNSPSSLATIQSGLQTLNPGVDWSNLPAGTAIKVPAQTYTIAAGDSFDSIAARFLIAATDLGSSTNATSTTLLAPLAVLALPRFDYTVVSGDTLQKVATKFNLTIAELADEVASVQSIFASPADPPLVVPDVPSYAIGDLASILITGSYANDAAMAVSRFLASGLRLPVEGDNSKLVSLYVATGQQLVCPAPPATITFHRNSGVTWFNFVSSFTATGEPLTEADHARHPRLRQLNPALDVDGVVPRGRILLGDTLPDLPFAITQTLLTQYAPSTAFDPHVISGPNALAIKQQNEVTYRLFRSVHWQAGSSIAWAGGVTAPSAGEPAIWSFSDALLARAAAVGYGTTAFGLFTQAGDPAVDQSTAAVAAYDWAAMVNLYVREVSAPNSDMPLPTTYELAGSDQAGKAILLALLQYLTGSGSSDTATIYVLYPPNAGSNNGNGVASGAIGPSRTFLVKTNLSTVTTSGPVSATALGAPKPVLYQASIAAATDFIQLLWEGCITASGGYLFSYTDTAGKGLPNEVFAATPLGELQLLVVLGSQSRSANPDRKLYAFNNCAVVGDNIDASQQTVFVAVTDKTKAEYAQAASIPPGNVGFELTRTKPTTTVTPNAAELRTQLLYSLLAYQSQPGGGFLAGPEGLPVSPAVPESGNTSIWDYRQVLSLAKLTASTLPSTTFLPAAAGDPYAGIAPGAQLTLGFAFHDLYGNAITPSTALANLRAKVGYYDDVVGLASWPGVTLSYTPGGTAAAPKLTLDASLQMSNYVPGSGTSFDSAQQNAGAHLVRYEAIYYQVWQSGLSLKLTTSLVPPGVTPGEFALDLIALAKFASASYLFIDTALLITRSTATAGPSAATLNAIAQQYTTDTTLLPEAIAALGIANQDVPTASLFSASIVMPELYTSAYGDTLTTITEKTKWNNVAISVVDLATQNQAVPLNAGTDIAAPQRTSAAAASTDSFDTIATAMKADVGAIAVANQNTRGLLTLGFPITVQNVTVAVALDSTSQETQSLSDLISVFLAQAVNTTPSVIAVSNAAQKGIFNSGRTLVVDDYVIQIGDTFASLAVAYPQFTITALATAAKDSPNVWASGLPLLIRFGTPVPLSATDTLKTISNVYGISVEELALANQITPLVTGNAVFLPDRITIDPTNLKALVPYTLPANGMWVNAIVTKFGEASATAFMTRNWQLRWIFIAGQPVTVGTASDSTKANDSFQSLYDRLKAKDPNIDQAQFIGAIAPMTTILTSGALFAAVMPSSGGATTSLSSLATSFASEATLVAQVNSSLSGFLVSGATVQLGALSLVTGPGETFTSLVSRFRLEYGVQTTVAEIASQNTTRALIAANQRFLLGPAAVTQSVALPLPVAGKPYSTNPFRATVTVTLQRDADRIDPQFANVASVKSSSSLIAPLTTPPTGGTSAAISLQTFAAAFETVFPKLKVAVGGDASQGGGTRDLWCVDFSADGIASVVIDGASPSFFSIPPIASSLQDLRGVPIQHYDAATGKLLPETDVPALDFKAIDLDVWASTCLAAIEQILSPGYAPAAFRLNPAALNQLIAAKQTLATNISRSVISILQGSGGSAGDASAQLEQALLANLSNGFATDAIVQYPVTVASKYTGPTYSAENAPRLVGKLVDDTYRTAAQDDIDSVAAFYEIPAAAIAMLLGQTIRILATGTAITFSGTPYTIVEGETIDALMLRVGATSYQNFVENLQTPNGFFLPYTVLNTDLVTGTTGDAGTAAPLITFAALADYYHMPLPLLATNVQTRTGIFVSGTTLQVAGHPSLVIDSSNNSLQLAAAAMSFNQPYELAVAMQLQAGKLNPAFAIRLVRLVPQHELTGAKVSLFSGSSTLNVLFNVKSEARAKNMFLRLDGHLNELEYDVRDIVAGYQASSWLSFVIPLTGGDGAQPVDTALGEVLIPIPLRAYPLLPSLAEQTGLAPLGEPATVIDAKKWSYAFTYRTQEAAQDTLYLQTSFNNAVSGEVAAALNPATLGPQLAQFVAVWPDVNTALAALLTWDGASNTVLAQTVQTFADLATRVTGAWSTFLLAKNAVIAGATYDYRMSFTTRSSADGLIDYRQSVLLTVLGATTPTPVADQYPAIEWRPTSGGDWKPLTMQSTTTTAPYVALYVYGEDVPAAQPIEHRMSIDGLDVVAWQNAIAAARITRNEHLVSTAPTSSAFVYNTGFISFPSPVVPFVQHENLIPFHGGLTRAAALEALFNALLGTTSAASYFLKTGIEFAYEIVVTELPAQPIASFLPVAFLPTSPYAASLPGAIDAQITQWSNGKPFSATQGLYSLDITVFTTLTPENASKVPILRLNHLVYDNSGGGSNSVSERLSISRSRRRSVIATRLERDLQRLAAAARAPRRRDE